MGDGWNRAVMDAGGVLVGFWGQGIRGIQKSCLARSHGFAVSSR